MAWVPLAAAAIGAVGEAAKGSPTASAPNRADQTGYQIFDSSGWIVATGSAKATGAAPSLPWPWILGGLALALLIWKRA